MTVTLHHLAGRAVGVYGLARSGLATVRAAVAGGAEVVAFDDRQAARDEAEALGARAVPFERWPWERLHALALSPGVPLTHPAPHPVVLRAREAGVEVLCDIELLWRETAAKARFIAITGTNGKSTTTALMGHVLKAAGLGAEVGGNIGRGALDLPPPDETGGRLYVLECSSYQLDLCHRFRPDVALFLNLTPDHLDRHGSMAGYAAAKERMFRAMGPDDTAVLGVDEPEMRAIADRLRTRPAGPRVETVSVKGETALWTVEGEGNLNHAGARVAALGDLDRLRGAHNWQNAASVLAGALALGLGRDTILGGMRSFPGLAHRMELVGRRGRVLFVNDSKATNADAAEKALAAFSRVFWIAGGQPKEGGIAPLAPLFSHVAKAYLIGEAAPAFAETLGGLVPCERSETLDRAVAAAAADAERDGADEPVVLLSPACASFDQFRDFEARGDAFRRLVLPLVTEGRSQ